MRGGKRGGTAVPGHKGRWLQFCACFWSPAQPWPGGLLEGAGLVQRRRRVLVAGRPWGLQGEEHSLQLDQPDQNPSTGQTDRQRVSFTSPLVGGVSVDARPHLDI